jgi:hypothetical protein
MNESTKLQGALITTASGTALWSDAGGECRCGRIAHLFINESGTTGCVACVEVKP